MAASLIHPPPEPESAPIVAGAGPLPIGDALNRPLFDDQGKPLGCMTLEEDGQILVGRWLGHCTPEAVMAGVRELLAVLRRHPCRAVLSDGSAAVGDWSDLIAWMQYEVVPQLVELGVQFAANVRSTDPAGRLAHQEYARVATQYVNLRLFDDPRAARQWLLKMLTEEAEAPRAGR